MTHPSDRGRKRGKGSGSSTAQAISPNSTRPVWNSNRRELRLAGKLVKKFGQKASNQESILNAFQRQGWPEGITDPLPKVQGINAKTRLGETVRSLNGCQKEARIRFW